MPWFDRGDRPGLLVVDLVAEIDERIGNRIDLIVDGGPAGIEPSTVIDLSKGSIEVLRVGRGDVSSLV